MKKKSKFLSLLLLILSITVNAQMANSIKINPEISKKIIENKNIDFTAFSVSLKEVDFPIYEIGKVPSKKYIEELEELKKHKTDFDKYQNEYNDSQKKYEEIKSIVAKIDEYLNSKENYDIKVNSLMDAQNIADKYKLQCIIEKDNTLKSSIAGNFGININNAPSNKIILIYKSDKRTGKSDLETYKNYINNISFKAPEESQGYREYNWQLTRLNSMSKTESGMVLSGKTQKKQIYILKDTLSLDYGKIEGVFSIVENKFSAVLTDIPNKFIKNQIVNENDFDYNTRLFTKSYNLIKKNDSDEYFFIMDDVYLSELEKEQKNNEIFEIIHKLGYKEYKDEYGDYFMKSKTCEIKLDTWTFSELRLNPAYITTLDNDQLKLATLVKQTIPHSKILDKYCGLYNIQRSRMSTIDIKNWRIATANALKLDKEIYKISEKYFGNYSFTLLDKSKTLQDFTDNVLASKGVLGM
jgi:hypothetical protein